MRTLRIIRRLGLFAILGIVGSAVGCDRGAQRGPTAEDKERGEIIKEGNREFYKQLKESAKAHAADRGAAVRKGKIRAKSGP